MRLTLPKRRTYVHQAVQFGMLIYDGVPPAAPINHRVGANVHMVSDLCPEPLFNQVCVNVRSQTNVPLSILC